MKILKAGFAILGLLAIAGCGSDDGNDRYENNHRRWWSEQRHEQAYERHQALSAHRAWCNDHPSDSSCEGWYEHEGH
jgi:hypothetical protein